MYIHTYTVIWLLTTKRTTFDSYRCVTMVTGVELPEIAIVTDSRNVCYCVTHVWTTPVQGGCGLTIYLRRCGQATRLYT